MRLTLLILGIFIMAVVASGFQDHREDYMPYRFRGSTARPAHCPSRRRVMNYDSANCAYLPAGSMDPSL